MNLAPYRSQHQNSMFTARVMSTHQRMSILAAAMFLLALTASAQTGSPMQYTGTLRIDSEGTPRALYGLSASTNQHSPELATRAFLNAHKHTLRLDNSATELVTDDVVSVPGGSHVRLSQKFNGVPVHGADVVVSLNARNEITMVVNNAVADVDVPVTPALTTTKALAIARQHLAADDKSIGQDDAASLIIFTDSLKARHLAYRVTMARELPSGDWELFVDATTGEVLQTRNLFVNYSENERVDGRGYVYLTDPLSAAGQRYGAPGFTDDNDRDSDSLTAYRTLVTLDSLTYAGGVFTLRGPFCTIADIESPIDSVPVVSASPEGFLFTRSQAGFEAVNAYYHVSQAYKRLRDLGFASARLQKIRIDPHGFQGQDNSHYSPTGNWIAFGTGGVDDAEDADVIWHEYGHAMQYSFSPAWGGGESAALGEGYADYWAASYSRSMNQWSAADDEYAWVYNWDGHNTYWGGRRVDNARTYPFTSLSTYAAGQIWSSTLMGIWGELGRDVTDRLVLKSMFYLGYGATGVDAANALIQADRDLYNGEHLLTLVYWLGTVKNFLDPEAMKTLTTDVDDADGSVPASFELAQNYPNPFNPSTRIGYSVGVDGRQSSVATKVRLAVYDLLGKEVAVLVDGVKEAGEYTVTWDAQGMASGVYFCRLTAGEFSAVKKMTLMR